MAQSFSSHDKTAPGTTGTNAERVNEETTARFSFVLTLGSPSRHHTPSSFSSKLSSDSATPVPMATLRNGRRDAFSPRSPPIVVAHSQSRCVCLWCAYAVHNRLSRHRYRQQQQRTYQQHAVGRAPHTSTTFGAIAFPQMCSRMTARQRYS